MHKKYALLKEVGNVSEKIRVALAGNPNVGKSTVFNALTGLKQHTGNWTGKTVDVFSGSCNFGDKLIEITDIPGTYSLVPHSKEESVARDFLCFSEFEKILVVCDATSLERNLFFVHQILELGKETVVCVNLLDEAKKKNIEINITLLEYELGVKVIGTTARKNQGIDEIKEILTNRNKLNPRRVKYSEEIEHAIEYIYPVLFKMSLKNLNKRWLSLRLLDSEDEFFVILKDFLGYDIRNNSSVKSAVDKAMHYLKEKGIEKEKLKETITESLYEKSQKVLENISLTKSEESKTDLKIDKFITGKYTSYLVMFLMLFIIFYITITGANIPSALLMRFFNVSEGLIYNFLNDSGVSAFVNDMLIKGGYRVLGWVVSVMLPPMAIFFPLFTILEDSGVLPRIAYVLDNKFQKSGTCGKQALTICMGFGCNCVGVTGARIIDSKRERLLAILTNSFTPCNGRFPALIKIISLFLITQVSSGSEVLSALVLSVLIVFSLCVTLLISNILSKTLLKGEKSHYILELPSYRRPQFSKIVTRSLVSRTALVLGRAAIVAFPAGIVIWLLINLGEKTFLDNIIGAFAPLGNLLGMDGEILVSFLLGVPANEIVLPLCLMIYSDNNELLSIENSEVISNILIENGWTLKTAISFMLFSVFHFPCATTMLTIFKETKSLKWLAISILLPTALGVIICSIFNIFFNLLCYIL